MAAYEVEVRQLSGILEWLMYRLNDRGGRDVELADAIDHLGAAIELLGGDFDCPVCGGNHPNAPEVDCRFWYPPQK